MSDNHEMSIAIIGMSGRFPAANNIDEFWNNICNAEEAISFFTEQEMFAEGIDANLTRNSNYVPAGGVLEDADKFDADFFGFTPNEARLLNPQHRVFLECVWAAMENAGYPPASYPGIVGVYAGSSSNFYLRQHLQANEKIVQSAGDFQLVILNSKDQLTTRVSHALNLTGPSINIQTACSTSLVAVHLACQSLLSGECNLALAGAVSIQSSQKTGYLFREGMTLSPDGHCRAFDANAKGTIGGNGTGVVVLKRYSDAIADGDRIDAIIRSTAINNDGNLKIGYTAPSIQRQADVIAEAIEMANLTADCISYVETHGTGTLLGDPIEIAGLKQAFAHSSNETQFCAIGSVKSNIGHLDVAAGIAGLIKTVLCLKHKVLPASINFDNPNPNIDFKNSPFYVNQQTCAWSTLKLPRRAGVSSFGIGGTNAHIILEEAPNISITKSKQQNHLLCISAKTSTELDRQQQQLIEFLDKNKNCNLRDIACTLALGREHFPHRRALIYEANEDQSIKLLATVEEFVDKNSANEYSNSFLSHDQNEQLTSKILESLGHSWCLGHKINFKKLFSIEKYQRLALPTYPFRRDRHWVDLPQQIKSTNNLHNPENNVLTETIPTTRPSSNTEIKNKLFSIWEEVLGLNNIDIEDDFFEIGGHSLLTVQLITSISKEFSINLPVVWVTENSTIAKQLAYLSTATFKISQEYQPLVQYRNAQNSTEKPIFLIHPGHAGAEVYQEFSKLIKEGVAVYAIDSYNLYHHQNPILSLVELAQYYIKVIQQVSPHGPYRLGGWSLGGTIAFEMAYQLQKSGHEIEDLFLIDSFVFNDLSETYSAQLDQFFYSLEDETSFLKLPVEYQKKILAIYPVELNLLRKYRAKNYNGSVILFNATLPLKLKHELSAAEKNMLDTMKDANGWRDYIVDLKEFSCDADHYSIMSGKTLNLIANTINQ